MSRVLLVDDDQELLEILAEWLVGRGHTVRMVSDGFRAEEEARQFGPDVVLLDGMLTGTTGTAVANRLRAAGHGGIIFLSGLPRGQFPGDVPVIEKPIDLDDLEQAIDRYRI